MGRKKKKSFFYFEKLNDFDKIILGVYGVFTVTLVFVLIFGDDKLKADVLFFYILIPQLAFVFFLYVSLRNFKVYLIWFSLSIIHLAIFIIFKICNQLLVPYAHLGVGINTIIMLLLFQGLRTLSLKMQNREFVNPAKSMDGKDLIENRKASTIDYILSVFFFAALGGLSALAAVVL